MIRSKLNTEAGRAEADKARESFQRRLNAAQSAPSPAEIDWQHYSKALPDIDVAKLKADYEKLASSIPAIPYDESADKANHEKAEAAWTGFENYCKGKVAELKQLQKEQQDHKLHRWYKRARVWQRFPGLYESLHHRVRGAWEQQLWGDYINYKARAVPLPWNEATIGVVDDAKKEELLKNIADKSGLSYKQAGVEEK